MKPEAKGIENDGRNQLRFLDLNKQSNGTGSNSTNGTSSTQLSGVLSSTVGGTGVVSSRNSGDGSSDSDDDLFELHFWDKNRLQSIKERKERK
ncbi:hypothetical protein Cantr_08867 [Candida viswanathii]|uniref:Uncharacterized protein n=1 Tax=Candida viswanathii TaxID=5486 RepID=A0A367Y9G5_9ASCO|nr:hypothetical protein Cantr_08867 [Candida viswanathii]